jgi:glycosyltransferase involved in cell wall biosynthesis
MALTVILFFLSLSMAMKAPEISVIIPVYRVSALIARSIKSIISQTFKGFELILVDDCGGDDSIEIAEIILNESWLKDGYKVLRNKENKGVAASRGVGMEASSGSCIIHLDSDDYFEPNLLETLFNALKDTGSDLAVCGYFAEQQKRTVEQVSDITNNWIIENEEEKAGYIKEMLANRVPSALWNKMAKREIYKKGEVVFHPNLRDDLSVSPLLVVWSEKMVLVNKPLIHYVMYNSTSVSSTVGHLNLIASTLNYLETRLPEFVKQKCNKEILSYKVKTRRKLVLHKNTDNQKLKEVTALFPEINRELLSGMNPETKIHYRFLSRLIAGGDSCLLRAVRWVLRGVIS